MLGSTTPLGRRPGEGDPRPPPAYAVANLRSVTLGTAITTYLRTIDDTLAPFHGRFLVHGAKPDVVEGMWGGDLVIIEFPDLERASAW